MTNGWELVDPAYLYGRVADLADHLHRHQPESSPIVAGGPGDWHVRVQDCPNVSIPAHLADVTVRCSHG